MFGSQEERTWYVFNMRSRKHSQLSLRRWEAHIQLGTHIRT
jgi:hypothetical protein